MKAKQKSSYKEKILYESQVKCFACYCDNSDVEVHSIKQQMKNRESEYENLIVLCPKCRDIFINEKWPEFQLQQIRQDWKKIQDNILTLLKEDPPVKPTEIIEACPYDPEKNFNKTLTENLFFSFLFYCNDRYKKELLLLNNALYSTDWNNRLIFLHGFGGIGKSTFLRYYMWKNKDQANHIPIDFQNVNYQLYSSSESIHVEEQDHIIAGLKNFITKTDQDDLKKFLKFVQDIKGYLSQYLSKDLFRTIEDVDLEKYKHTKSISLINSLNFNDTFVFFFLFLFLNNKRTNSGKVTIVYFDNLDRVKFEYISSDFKEQFPEILTKITLLSQEEKIFYGYKINFVRKFKFVFCLRDANNSNLHSFSGNANDSDRLWANTIDHQISLTFDQDFYLGLTLKRINFINTICDQDYLKSTGYSNKMIGEIFRKLFNDDYFKRAFFPLFNYDIRKLLLCLYDVIIKNDDYLGGLSELLDSNPYVFYGGIIYGVIRNLSNNDFIQSFVDRNIPHDRERGYCDPIRVILTVLLNLCNMNSNNYDESLKVEKEYPLYNFIQQLRDIFPKKEILETLSKYFLLHERGWVHFITLKNKRILASSSFDEELTKLETIKQLNKLSILSKSEKEKAVLLKNELNNIKIKINPVGFSFLRYFIIHFEYFSVIAKNEKPLFQPVKELPNGPFVFNFEEVIDNVYSVVKRYFHLINRFFERVFIGELNFNIEDWKLSHFAFKYFKDEAIARETGMLYTIRVITAHISYIDKFRIYILDYHKDDFNEGKRTLINRKVISYIEKYIRLLNLSPDEKNAEFFSGSFESKIKYIRGKNYSDFSKPITID